MSVQQGKLISTILNERFGEVVEKVGSYLFKLGPSPILFIKKFTELPLSKIKESLCILIKYGLVTFKPNKNSNIANYYLNNQKVLLMIRYPAYINLIKQKFGEDSEIMLEEILHKGCVTASDVILAAKIRLEKDQSKVSGLAELRDSFQCMVNARYIQIVPISSEEKFVPDLILEEDKLFIMPQLDLKMLSEKQQGIDHKMTDSDTFWCINHDRFHQDMRDKLIVSAVTRKFDEQAGEIIRLFLQQMYIRTSPWACTSNPIPALEVKEQIKKMNKYPQLIVFFDQYINIIEQETSTFLSKAGEAGGGSYQIHMKDIFTQFTWETVENIVLEKFDSKAARIFRLVKTKGYIEPEQIQKLVMIPAKEAKRLTYQLLEDNFLTIQELKKSTNNAGPIKSFILFHIKLDQVVRMLLELCYKTVYNTLIRRNHDRSINKRILDKKQRVDTISLSMKTQGATEEQLQDIEDMLTPPERESLQNIENTMRKLNLAELEVDDTIFLFELYLRYE